MKRIILTILAIATVSSLTGCAGSLIRSGYNLAVTPETDICENVLGKSSVDAEKLLKMGKPDSVSKKLSGKQVRIYTKGKMKAILNVEPDGIVSEANCDKEEKDQNR